MNNYIKDLELESNVLLISIFILTLTFIICSCFSIKKKSALEKENAKLHQQVIDYEWQLERVEYIIKCERGE